FGPKTWVAGEPAVIRVALRELRFDRLQDLRRATARLVDAEGVEAGPFELREAAGTMVQGTVRVPHAGAWTLTVEVEVEDAGLSIEVPITALPTAPGVALPAAAKSPPPPKADAGPVKLDVTPPNQVLSGNLAGSLMIRAMDEHGTPVEAPIRLTLKEGKSLRDLPAEVQTGPHGLHALAVQPMHPIFWLDLDTTESFATRRLKHASTQFVLVTGKPVVQPGERLAVGVRSLHQAGPVFADVWLGDRWIASTAATLADGEARFFLPLPAETFDPGRELNLDLNLAWPRLEGRSRGARTARLRIEPRDGERSYDDWLAYVAKTAAEALGEGDTCGCEVVVQPMNTAQGLWIAPCADPPAPPPADPTPFTPDRPLKAPRLPITGGTGWITTKPKSCADLNGQQDLRLWAWCQFQDVTRTKVEFDEPWWDVDQYLGLPIWESFRPLSAILPVWWLDEDEPGWVIDPRDMPVQMKAIMVEPALHYAFHDRGYYDPCKMAARAHYCHNAQAGWMPKLPSGKRVIKTFFVPEGRLPAGANLADYYSYQPPGEARHYLVGMHVAVSNSGNFGAGSYFQWATFWVPPPPNATETRDGTPLELIYNPVCNAGGGGDRPVELNNTPWGKFSMCIQGDGTGACGNPWGPKNECVAAPGVNLGCEGCHSQPMGGGTFEWTVGASPGEPEMNPAWLAFLAGQAPAARECMDYILEKEAANHPVYENLVKCDGF
ncbi:MAG: hypothetical protein KC549_11590, partial [Myxococcales bacterium]|nr:hypothetical protein [Myxococcales bacterium]